jgi:Flp pilus assembly protein TadD
LSDAPGIDQLVARGKEPQEFATHIPLLSLARLFKTNLENIPAKVPYLFAERRRLERWEGPIRSIPGFRVGISWQGSKGFKADRHRSIPLRHFERLAKVPGVELISLQKGYGTEQIAKVADRFSVRELPANVDQDGAFLDTVAIMKHLDLVITSDTSMAHIAGALGVPVWVVIPFAADWRWLLDRSDSPWYPSMRIFRQNTFGDWPEVFARVETSLVERVHPQGLLAPVVATPPDEDREIAELHERGSELLRNGKPVEAEPLLRQALSRKPDRWDTHQNLAVALARQGKFDAAIALFSKYLDHHPQSGDGFNNLGLACMDSNKLADAERYFVQAIRFKSGNPDAHNNLGAVLVKQERWNDAVAALQHALRLRPDHADAHGNLGFALRKLKKPEEALYHYQRALEIRPTAAQAHVDAGLTLVELQRLEEAEVHFRRATALHPDSPDAFNNLGVLLADLHRLDEADAVMARCVELRPEHPESHRNYALVLLSAGKLERGFAEYEWRLKASGEKKFAELPYWDGSPLEGKTIVVYAEQGLGDTLHLARYLPLIKERGGKVLLSCQPPLVPLLQQASLDADKIVPGGAPVPEAEVMVGLFSLPHIFQTSAENIPAQRPYLRADAERVARWKQHLANIQGFRIGIAWQGSPGYGGDCYRSIPLKHFAALARVPGVQLISLQKGHGLEQLAGASGAFMPIDLSRQIDESGGAFLDSAAVMANLDLVISSDTSLVHLAGALGVPTWVALSTCSDWRWLRDRDDSPWYPSLRLFRQKTRGNWTEVFANIAEALHNRVQAWSVEQTCRVDVGVGELADKITILQIKRERLQDPAKLANVGAELAAILPVYESYLKAIPELAAPTDELKTINEALWDIEDAIRLCERDENFGDEFIRLARAVYQTNDQRAHVKRQINQKAGSRIIEEKGYQNYARS